MSFWTRCKPPVPEDYATDEEYEEAVTAYENAEYRAEEESIERYYERKSNK